MSEQFPPTGLPMPAYARERIRLLLIELKMGFSEFAGPGRSPEAVAAREIAAVILHDYRGPAGQWISFPEVARVMGRNNHSTIITMHARAKANPERMLEVARLAAKVTADEHAITGLPPMATSSKPAAAATPATVQFLHVMRITRRLIDELASGQLAHISDARSVASPLVAVFPTAEEIAELDTLLSSLRSRKTRR